MRHIQTFVLILFLKIYVSAVDKTNLLKNLKKFLESTNIEQIKTDIDSAANDLMKHNFCLTNEDKDLNGTELLKKYGYDSEMYTVQANDDYLLKLVRIPRSGPAVVVVHGLLSSYEDFITSGPRKALGYLLSDAGYDVWFINTRGNKLSRNHTRLSPNKKKFWKFSWHEMGIYDLPASIDFILEKTGQSQVIYIGHSQGTTVSYVMLSQKPEYNDKIKLLISLAPVAWMTHVKSPLVRAMAKMKMAEFLEMVAYTEFMPSDSLFTLVKNIFCGTSLMADTLCTGLVLPSAGFDYSQMNISNFCVELNHSPSGCSTRQLIHFIQEMRSQKFRQFDYGRRKNMRVYGSKSPPEYDVSKVRAPVALFYANNDWLSSVTDVHILHEHLPNVVYKYLVPYEKWSHLDYLWAKDAKIILYDTVIDLMKKYA